MAGLILFVIWLFAVLFSMTNNRDIFSPTKFYFLYIFIFFADIFFSSYNYEVYLTYLILIVVGLNIALLERFFKNRNYCQNEKIQYAISSRKLKKITIILWLLSLVPIMAQIWFINYFGGIEGYINIIALRVLEFRALGPVMILIKMMAVINIFYYGVGLIAQKKRPSWWFFYIFHLIIVILIALLSGSRGGLLNNFVTMAVLYHYLKHHFSIRVTLLFAVSLLFVALVLGVARSSYKLTEGAFKTGLTDSGQLLEQRLETKYGLIGLELVYSKAPKNLQYGLTFLTAVTNFVPRKLWPGKPDTGGVVLTKIYVGEETSRTTNYSTGIIAESILNFGQLAGILFGFISLFSMMFLTVYIYSKIIFKLKKAVSPLMMIQLSLYILFMRGITSLSVAEFTATFVGVATTMIPLWLIYIMCFRLKIVTRSAKRYIR